MAVAYSEHAKKLLRDHCLMMQGYPRLAQPKRTRRSRRRARGKHKASVRTLMRGDSIFIGDMHFGELISPTGRQIAKQQNFYLNNPYGTGWERFRSTYHNPELIPGVTVQGSIMGGDLLHEYRTFAAVDWASIEAKAIGEAELTKMHKRMEVLIDKTLRSALMHGSSENETEQEG